MIPTCNASLEIDDKNIDASNEENLVDSTDIYYCHDLLKEKEVNELIGEIKSQFLQANKRTRPEWKCPNVDVKLNISR